MFNRAVWGAKNTGVSSLIDLTILEPPIQPSEGGSLTLIIIIVAAAIFLIGLVVALICFCKKRKSKTETV